MIPDQKVRPKIDDNYTMAIIIICIGVIVFIVLLIVCSRIWARQRDQKQLGRLAVTAEEDADGVNHIINQQPLTADDAYHGSYLSDEERAVRESGGGRGLESDRDVNEDVRQQLVCQDSLVSNQVPEDNNLQTGSALPDKEGPEEDVEIREAAEILDMMQKQQHKDSKADSDIDTLN